MKGTPSFYLVVVKVNFKSSVYKYALPFLVFVLPVNLIFNPGFTKIIRGVHRQRHRNSLLIRKDFSNLLTNRDIAVARALNRNDKNATRNLVRSQQS